MSIIIITHILNHSYCWFQIDFYHVMALIKWTTLVINLIYNI